MRILSIMEAETVTGPAKNLLELGARGKPQIELHVAGYRRGGSEQPESLFLATARKQGFPASVIDERGSFDRAVLGRIETLIHRTNPDIVQTHNVKSHFLMRLSGLWRKYRWLAFHHGYTTTDTKMRMYNQLDRWSLRVACHVMTVCGPFRDQLKERGIPERNITVRHNAVNPFVARSKEETAVLRQKLGLASGVPVLLMVGRLSHEKGHREFLEALAINRLGDRCHGLIVGEGPERVVIERERQRLGLKDRVILAGHQTDIGGFLSLASAFVMPSHSEGSPNAMLEAMAAGLPIVASAVGGIPELVEDGKTAFLLPPRQPGALAQAMERSLTAEGLKLGQQAKAQAAHYNYETYLRGMIEMYGNVMRLKAGEQL